MAAELDSFDGRKDPERCACLVNRLRNCQDKLLNICNKMIEELEPGAIKRSREFRAKYPGKHERLCIYRKYPRIGRTPNFNRTTHKFFANNT